MSKKDLHYPSGTSLLKQLYGVGSLKTMVGLVVDESSVYIHSLLSTTGIVLLPLAQCLALSSPDFFSNRNKDLMSSSSQSLALT